MTNPLQVCDFKSTCTDGSDERVCGTCDFETGGCGWTNDVSADFTWTYAKGSTYSWDSKPSVDHTTGTSDGHFLYATLDWWSGAGRTARVSTKFAASEFSCTLSFWYNTAGTGFGSVNVYINSTTHNMT